MLTKIWCGNIEIADGSSALAGPVLLPGTGRVQTHEPIRGPGPVNIDRIGKTYDVSFTVNKTHATRIAAALFRAQHRGVVPNVADLVITWTVSSDVVRATIAGAAWQVIDPQLMGIATSTSYRVTGGPLAVVEELAALQNQDGVSLLDQDGTTLNLD